VNDEYLRFDFSHFEKVSEEDLQKIEQAVNARIEANLPLNVLTDVPIEEANGMGDMALFGVKYGDKVRVVKFGSSVELCGGTHVSETGRIQLFKIMNESSIAAGIRRIEAWTGKKVLAYYQEQEQVLGDIKTVLKQSVTPLEAIEKLQQENADLKKQLAKFAAMQEAMIKEELKGKIKEINGVPCLLEIVDLDSADAVKNIAFQFKNEINSLFMVLGAEISGKPLLSIMVSDDLIESKDLHAGNLVRELAKAIQGGGGGQAFFATAGGKNTSGLQKALELAEEQIKRLN
jgi:alanyl-tRNA synthetase